MTDFDTRLRADLARAAELAPPFRGIRSEEGAKVADVRTRRRPPRWPALAAAAAVAAIVGATAPAWWPGDDGGETAQCAAVLQMGEVRYTGYGELVRVPRPARDLGPASVLGCQDVEDRDVQAATLRDVDPAVAVFADGSVWVAEGADPPARLDVLREPVTCQGDQVQVVTGDWVSVSAMPDEDGVLVPPYVASIQADAGDGLPLDEFSSVLVDVTVTTDTSGADDPALVTEALQGDEPVHADVTCSGGRFVASSLTMGR